MSGDICKVKSEAAFGTQCMDPENSAEPFPVLQRSI